MSLRKKLEESIKIERDNLNHYKTLADQKQDRLVKLEKELASLPEEHQFVPGRNEGFFTPSISGEKNIILWKGASIQDAVFDRCVKRGVISENADDAVEISLYLQVITKLANLAKQLNRKYPLVGKTRYEIFAEGTRIDIVYSNVHAGITFNSMFAAETALSCLSLDERKVLLKGIK